MNSPSVKSLSPLNEYWKSNQDHKANQERLSLLNAKSPASFLFRNEPYKWEVLYQSSMNDILRGDLDAIPALNILLGTLHKKARIEFIHKLSIHKLFDREIISSIDNTIIVRSSKPRPILKKIIILSFIFLNPYGIELKGDKQHVYEHTGAFFNKLIKLFKHQ